MQVASLNILPWLVCCVPTLHLLSKLPIVGCAGDLSALLVLRLEEGRAATLCRISFITKGISLWILTIIVHNNLAYHLGLEIIEQALVGLLLRLLLLLLLLHLSIIDRLKSIIIKVKCL